MKDISLKFEGIGTAWQIDIADEIEENKQQKLLTLIKERIAVYDRDYSRFREDSLITKMSKEAGSYTLPRDAKPLFDVYQKFYNLTDGLVTPLIGRLMEEAGYDAKYSLVPKELHVPPLWEEVLEYDYPNLVVKKPSVIDLGAAGKGYLIDIVSCIIRDHAIKNFCVDAGGDIFYESDKNEPLRIGLENPHNVGQVIGVAHILNQSICGSAGNRRAWAQFHHIINPKTLSSPRDIAATWVVAPTTLLADILTTCLFFVPRSSLVGIDTFEYAILYADNSLEKSAGFPGEFFTS
jgi:FAD:protein FMN transferase